MRKQVDFTNGDKKGNIDDLIDWLQECKNKGATEYEMTWSGDPVWAYKWFRCYSVLTEDEIKENKRIELKKQLLELE